MKLDGNYIDHPTQGLMRVPKSVLLNQYEYAYDPDLGFIKKLKSGVKKVGRPFEKLGKKTGISKLVPKELKGNILKPMALAAGGYGLYTLGAGGIAAGAAKAGGAAMKAGGAIASASKAAIPLIGKAGSAVLTAASGVLSAYSQVKGQQAQAAINAIETQDAIYQLHQQQEHEKVMLDLARAQSANPYPPQGIVYPGASGPPTMQVSAGQPGAGGFNSNTLMLAGAGVLAVILLTGKKR